MPNFHGGPRFLVIIHLSRDELSNARGEKKVLVNFKQPISHVRCCAAPVHLTEKMFREGTSSTTERSLLQSVLSLLSTAAVVHNPPTPLSLSLSLSPSLSSLSLSLSLSLTRFDAFNLSQIVLNLHNMLPILGRQLQHLSHWPVLFEFSL